MVWTIAASGIKRTDRNGAGPINMPSFSMSIDDQTVVDLLIKYVQQEIIPSPSLRQFVKNKFRTDEQLRFHLEQ